MDISAAMVWALFVDPEFEGRGAGKILHEFLIKSAANSGLEQIRLSTESGSRAARFYEAAGWKHAGKSTSSDEDIYELQLA